MTQRWLVGIIVGIVALGAVAYVGVSLNRPEPPTYAPTPVGPRPAEGRLVGPVIHTVDAREADRWQFFSFAQGTVVEDPRPFEWDLAFRRFQVIVNGGNAFPGMAGVQSLGELPFEAVTVVPEEGYFDTEVARGDSIAAPLGDWYSYSFLSHLLSPGEGTYAVRTADGRYAKLRFLGYYCPGAQPGCVTFEYVYQGGGGRELTDASADHGGSPETPVE